MLNTDSSCCESLLLRWLPSVRAGTTLSHWLPGSYLVHLLKSARLFLQEAPGGRSWGQAARDEAHKAGSAAGEAADHARESLHHVFHGVTSSGDQAKGDPQEDTRSALAKLKARLDEAIHPINFVDKRLSVGLIPSNTEVCSSGRVWHAI